MATSAVTKPPAKAEKKVRQRSPNYPTVGLPEAIERVRKLFEADGRAGVPTEIAAKHIGYATAHGQAYSVLSALKKFGLLDEEKGRVSLSRRAIELLNLPATDPRRIQSLKDAALSPPIYRELVDAHAKTGLPGDESLEAELVTYKNFNPKSVAGFVKDFKATLEFAGLSDFSMLGSKPKAEDEPPKVKVGDFVQWESRGQHQFREPKRVREITEDGKGSKFVLVDGSPTGAPIAEVTVEEPPANLLKPRVHLPIREIGTSGGSATMRQDVFSVTEGDVVLSWPTPLSLESIQEVQDWLKIAERKIIRSERSKSAEPEPQENLAT
jgi:hypothetical protein